MTAKEQFPERPQFEALAPHELNGTTQLYVFTRPWPYRSPRGDGVIPEGFVTDFASIPAFFRRYMDDDDPRILYAALRHDHRYKTGALSRQDADKELAFDGMKALGARWDQRNAVYTAVRVGGGRHYHETSP